MGQRTHSILTRSAKRVAQQATGLMSLALKQRPWAGLGEIRSADILVTRSMGLGDLLMVSALFAPLLSRGIRLRVVGSKYPPVFSDVESLTFEDYTAKTPAGDRLADLLIFPDFSFRNLQYLQSLVVARHWVGYPLDWYLRSSFSRGVLGAVVHKAHWQDRIQRIAQAIGISDFGGSYYNGLRTERWEGKPIPSPFIVLNLITDQPVRSLRPDVNAQVVQSIVRAGFTAVIVGEKRFTERLGEMKLEMPGVVSLLGQTSLYQMHGLIQASAAYVGIDSGPMHVAFAYRKPVFAFMKGVHPDWRRPLAYGPGELFSVYSPCPLLKGTELCFDPWVGFASDCNECSLQQSFSSFETSFNHFLKGLRE